MITLTKLRANTLSEIFNLKLEQVLEKFKIEYVQKNNDVNLCNNYNYIDESELNNEVLSKFDIKSLIDEKHHENMLSNFLQCLVNKEKFIDLVKDQKIEEKAFYDLLDLLTDKKSKIKYIKFCKQELSLDLLNIAIKSYLLTLRKNKRNYRYDYKKESHNLIDLFKYYPLVEKDKEIYNELYLTLTVKDDIDNNKLFLFLLTTMYDSNDYSKNNLFLLDYLDKKIAKQKGFGILNGEFKSAINSIKYSIKNLEQFREIVEFLSWSGLRKRDGYYIRYELDNSMISNASILGEMIYKELIKNKKEVSFNLIENSSNVVLFGLTFYNLEDKKLLDDFVEAVCTYSVKDSEPINQKIIEKIYEKIILEKSFENYSLCSNNKLKI